MDLLAHLRERATRLDRAAFARDHLGLYLLGDLPDSDDLRFRTQIFTPDLPVVDESRPSTLRSVNKGAVSARERFLAPVAKSDRNAWKNRISVGRATNNDIVLRHVSVSKLHAHFFVRATPRPGLAPLEELVLSDAGSANGTRVNGTAVKEGEAGVVVKPGDSIGFGEVHCELLDAGMLHFKLRVIFSSRTQARDDF